MKRPPRLDAIVLLAAAIVFGVAVSGASGAAKTAPGAHVASWWEGAGGKTVQCGLCPRRCVIDDGKRGVCTVRVNRGGTLYTLGYANPVAVHVDPIEKKPFFHVMPGSRAFSIAVAGCNMRCLFCQNWQISQSRPDETTNYDLPPADVVSQAKKSDSAFIVFTYTEPTVFYEYMLDIAKGAKANGMRTGSHTCGYINPEPLRELLPYLDAVNVDLKGFNEAFYRKMGAFAELKPVLDTIVAVKKAGVWLEITNLIIPGQNDDPAEIRQMCRWIKEHVGDEVPLHFSRFSPSFKLQNLPPTPLATVERAYRIAKEEGLQYVYIGNIPGTPYENTYCPRCGKLIISRVGYEVLDNRVKKGACGFCGYAIAGRWGDDV